MTESLGLLPRGKDDLCRPLLVWAYRGYDLAEHDPSSGANTGDAADQLADGTAWRETLNPECCIR